MSFFSQIDAAIRNVRADLRFGSRSLRKTPVFTVVAVIALALGIGATTAILSVVNAVLLRPLPYANSDRLVVILHNGNNPVAPANVIDWKKQTHSFTDVAAAEYWGANLTSGEVVVKLFCWGRGVVAKHAALSRLRSRVRIPSLP